MTVGGKRDLGGRLVLAMALLAILGPLAQAGAVCRRVEPGALWNYEGTIGDDLRVRMTLVFGDEEVTGVYFYARHFRDIRLRGRIEEGTRLRLDELDASGQVTARFEATFPERDPRGRYGDSPLECEVIAGTWSTADGRRSLPVYLASESRTSGSLKHRYGSIGVRDDEVVNRGATAFWRAVQAQDRAAVAQSIAFPITVNVAGRPRRLKNAADLLRVYDQVFTPAFRESILSAMPRHLFVRDEGAMLGHGQVWFGANGKVRALNN